jgi:hypothetical protein
VFVRLGDVVRALRALEARGGSARLALFERMWGHYAYAALGLALEWGLAERRGDVYRLSWRGRRLLRELDGCPYHPCPAGRHTSRSLHPSGTYTELNLSFVADTHKLCGC